MGLPIPCPKTELRATFAEIQSCGVMWVPHNELSALSPSQGRGLEFIQGPQNQAPVVLKLLHESGAGLQDGHSGVCSVGVHARAVDVQDNRTWEPTRGKDDIHSQAGSSATKSGLSPATLSSPPHDVILDLHKGE